MKLTGQRSELLATPCKHCQATGIEPHRKNLVCSLCGGVQYINGRAETEGDVMFEDFDALRLAIKLLRRKDQRIIALNKHVANLEKRLAELQPYLDQKTAQELKDKVYPPESTQLRANTGAGGYGD